MRLLALIVSVAVLAVVSSALTGCNADPQDTHITSPVAAPR